MRVAMVTELLHVLQPADAAVTGNITHPYTHGQLVRVLEKVALSTGTLNQTLMQAQQCTEHEGELLTVLLDAAQLHAMLIGGMADDASNSEIIGDFQGWFYGPNFRQEGVAA